MMKFDVKSNYERLLPQNVREIFNIISVAAFFCDYKIFLVGGIVRDLILGKKNFDIDIIVEGDALQFITVFLKKKLNFEILQIQNDLGTVKIKIDNLEVDFASTRMESYPKKGHMPVIQKLGCSISQDSIRRDFTINSLYLSLNKEDFLKIYDFEKGLADIESKTLRVLHDMSFYDDPTRIIRMFKFAIRLGFIPDLKTLELQNKYLKMPFSDICYERVKSELKQIFCLNNPTIYDNFIKQELYKIFSSKVEVFNSSFIKNTIDKYIIENNKWLIWLGCMLSEDHSKLEKFNLVGFQLKILKTAYQLVENKTQLRTNWEIYSFFKNAPSESVILYYILTADEKAIKYNNELKHVKLIINGNDLIKLGVESGIKIGIILELTLKEKLNEKIHSRQEEIEFIKKHIC